MSSASNSPRGPLKLETLLKDVVLHIMGKMTPSDLVNFVLTNKRFLALFNRYKNGLMVSILKELPESETMTLLYTTQLTELHPAWTLRPRAVDVQTASQHFIKLMQPNGDYDQIYHMSPAGILTLWKMTKVIDWWVQMFPTLYWRDSLANRRHLTPNEEWRLRKAIAHWWLYAHHHHGFSYAFRQKQIPKPYERDPRVSHMRRLSTCELMELRDLWAVVHNTVSNDICSSAEAVCFCQSPDGVAFVPWGHEQQRHASIVRTYMKLDPRRLRYYLLYYPNCNRNFVTGLIRQQSRAFDSDIETLSFAINRALIEREHLREIVTGTFTPTPIFGILDDTRTGVDVSRWDVDQWLNANLHRVGPQVILTRRVPRGDDGSDRPIPW